jgi:hypothetical protein
MEKCTCVCRKTCLCLPTLILSLIGVALLVYVAFFKNDAQSLEAMKAGGMDNLQKIFQLYNTEEYKAQQSQAIDTLL